MLFVGSTVTHRRLRGFMAALTGGSELGLQSAGDGVSEPRARRATVDQPTGPDLLAEAGAVLPTVVGRGLVRCVDVHTALYEAAYVLGVGRDRPHRLRLADETLDLFVEFLVARGLAAVTRRGKETVRGWLIHVGRAEVQLTLAAAAGYWRRELR
jgi:hypothetical protein